MKSNFKESLHKISCHGSEARTLGVLRQTLGYEDDDSMDVHTWFFSSDKDYENAQRKLDDYEHSHRVDLDYMAESNKMKEAQEITFKFGSIIDDFFKKAGVRTEESYRSRDEIGPVWIVQTENLNQWSVSDLESSLWDSCKEYPGLGFDIEGGDFGFYSRKYIFYFVDEDEYKESSVRSFRKHPMCYVIKDTETGKYYYLPQYNTPGWTDNRMEAEALESVEEAKIDITDIIIPEMISSRHEGESNDEYYDRTDDEYWYMRQNRFEIEPVYPIDFRESSRTTHYRTSQGNRSDTFDDYPNGISRYTSVRDWDPEPITSWNFPKLFDDDSDLEDWEDNLRKDYTKKYYDEASDWMSDNGDDWNEFMKNRRDSISSYNTKKNEAITSAKESDAYKKILNDIEEATFYKNFAKQKGWRNTVKKQEAKLEELNKAKDRCIEDYMKDNFTEEDPSSIEDTYLTQFNDIFDRNRSAYDEEVASRKDSFKSSAEGKELYSGRDIDTNDLHFYYKNGDNYRQIGSRSSIIYPYGTSRGIEEHYLMPDATQEFDDYASDRISFLKPVEDYNTRVLSYERDSTD